jgi:surfeit locus 1 family protein
MRADRKRRRSWIGLLIPALFVFVVLIGLGTWQLQRKAWKEGLIAALGARLATPPVALPSAAAWPSLDPQSAEYRRVAVTVAFDNAKEGLVFAAPSAFRPDVTSPGYWVFTPARLADGGVVMVNRGFVPEGRQDPISRPEGQLSGPLQIVGVMRWPDGRHWFTPNDEPAHNLWFSRDPQAIAAAKGLGPEGVGSKSLAPKGLGPVAPFYIEQESPAPPGGLPQPGKLIVKLPDNHLQYALTWYGLAIVLVLTFATWAFGSAREEAERASPSPRRQGALRSL